LVHRFSQVDVFTDQLTKGNPLAVIHDADDRLAHAIAARDCGLVTRLNEPYSAADGVAHMLARHATPLGLRHAMLELRNDLIATPQAQAAMAARLAPVIRAAITEEG
ncbi:MAG TPA: PhzF family phenazine biosynthesis protein, partial [Paracoccus sp. (in: a-proteobacteria)]|nr:PhzF family phenazine biosynthesis protein [Paracoccus sp. (in: a-proteobacteria)]